jgi:hypothetical protein
LLYIAEQSLPIVHSPAPVTLAGGLVLEVIHQVGPGGDFLTHKHTLKRFRDLW